MNKFNVFVVDDEEIIRVTLADDLKDAGFNVFAFADPITALNQIEELSPDVIFSDIKMPGINGIELLKEIKKINRDISVIMMTAHGSISNAVEAIKLGAYDYITKPFESDEILLLLNRIQELKSVKHNYKIITSELQSHFDYLSIIGSSNAVKETISLIKTVANTNTTVLITGETGTGKELVTNVLHYNSNRKDKPFIKVSCGILSKEIFESELFGYEKGAFTGANKLKKGRFELADNGTIYLDDVDDTPIELQVKLLRVLEQQEFERVGGSETIKINVRVIASTKADLKKLVEEGRFREDLYYRLNVFPIHLKPLRERPEDIPLLIDFFIQKIAGKNSISIEEDAMRALVNYNWPGNVRELKNLMERLTLLAKDNKITLEHIPFDLFSSSNRLNNIAMGKKPLDEIISSIEIDAIKSAILKCGGNKAKAAEFLGLPVSTLRSKMDKYKIE